MRSISPTPNLPRDKNPEGCLYIVATPIGNMDDITVRALKILREVDLVAAEDTRHTGKLLARHGIKTSLISYHEHNEKERTPILIDRLIKGESIALVSDAGTPSISDPGYRLVKAATGNHIHTIPIPGVSAAVAALSASGLPTDAFTFVGFPARKKNKRQKLFKRLAEDPNTLIFYESPHRIAALLKDAETVMGDRYAVLGREMTKLHEEFLRGPLSEIHRILGERQRIKGECTLVVSGAVHRRKEPPNSLREEIKAALESPENKPSWIAKQLSAKYGRSRSNVYEEIMKIKGAVAGDRAESRNKGSEDR